MKIKCTNCKYEGNAKVSNRGSFLLMIFLLCLGVFPGILYLLWMVTGRNIECPRCGWKHCVKIK